MFGGISESVGSPCFGQHPQRVLGCVSPLDRSGRCALQAVVAEGEAEVEAEQPAAEVGSGIGSFWGIQCIILF